ncbi:MAG TPA: TraR/DksA C4-type zinc finger protein [Burkholderiales bacterium]|nr:TraR/DksA C4-type zinc finger protein [Burkholderiales bacterium]
MANLTSKQTQKLKQAMLERQRLLTTEVADQRSQAAADGNDDSMGGVGDAGDESVVRMMTDLHLQEAGRDLEELRDIDGALQRIEAGEYGDCIECGNEISYARLEAQPTAIRCVECQSLHEKTYASKSTPTM